MIMTIPDYLQAHTGRAQSGAFRQLINGELVDGASNLDIIDPALGTAFAEAPVADSAQVDAAVAAAKAAFPAWSALTYDERAEVLSRVADVIEENAELFARLVVREQGKPLADAMGDSDWAVAFTRYYADWRPEREIVQDDSDAFIEIIRRPIGVVAAIVPWNFPFFQGVYKIAPALLTGNTVVCKPSPTTPLSTMLLAELVKDVVPPGVLNIVGDDGQVGPLLTSHPDVGKVSFTGSITTGKHVMTSAAATLKRVTLELGGNDAAIVLPDADIKKVAEGIFGWAFANAGQVCINIKRIFVPNSLKAEFEAEIGRIADAVVVGPGLSDGTQMGPLQNGKQYDTIRDALKLAQEQGRIVAGGDLVGDEGYFVRPTLITDIPDDSRLAAEETFGPVRTIFGYDDVDEAVRRANGTSYGLGGSVWGTDIAAATEVASRLEAGSVWVNQHFQIGPNLPFGGRKESGLGHEFGLEGLHGYSDIQVVNVSRV